jgi:CubicO group peptidase (beta-lactamase class C family)
VDTLYQQVVAKEQFSGLPSRSLEEVISEITALPLANQPGERWRYSVAVDVLGYLVQVIADMPFETFLQTALFEPLGMVDTHFRLPDAKAERLATLYQATPEGDRVRLPQGAQQRCLLPQPCPSGGGGLVSTAPDYFRFAQMLLNGGELDGVRVLGPRIVEFMTLNHLPAALLPYRTSAGPNPGLGFGLGVSVVMDPAATNLPSSIGTYGWGGAAATRFRVDPQEDLVTLIMPQLFTNPHPFGRQFAVMAYQALVD